MNKIIWILWLQGWDSAPYLNKQALESWRYHNPTWKIELVTFDNLKTYVNDIDYVYNVNISDQAKSDIIRLSLLKNHGGVYTDSNVLCLQPLDSWIYSALSNSQVWMYRATTVGLSDDTLGCASWFIISMKDSYITKKWKEKCDEYWSSRVEPHDYFWMNCIFKELIENDTEFKKHWLNVPNLSSENEGGPHCMSNPYHRSFLNEPDLKTLLENRPPYIIKLWSRWTNKFPDIDTEECKNSNGFYAIQLSKKSNLYYHQFKKNISSQKSIGFYVGNNKLSLLNMNH